MKMKELQQMDRNILIKRVLLYAIGVIFMPLGVVFTINAHLGAGGYDALNFAVADVLGIEVSLGIYLTAGIVVLITAAIRRSFPRLLTFVTSFLLGLTTDIWNRLFHTLQGDTLFISVILLIIGLVVISIAVAAYILSGLPTNPTDDFVVALSEKKWQIRWAKIFLDSICVVLALLLHGEIGVGTILCTAGLGPLINAFMNILKRTPLATFEAVLTT